MVGMVVSFFDLSATIASGGLDWPARAQSRFSGADAKIRLLFLLFAGGSSRSAYSIHSWLHLLRGGRSLAGHFGGWLVGVRHGGCRRPVGSRALRVRSGV